MASAVALAVFAISSCSFRNDPYQISADQLRQNAPLATAVQFTESCVGLPRGVAATADLGRIVVKANEAVFVLSMRTGVFASIETPAPSVVVMARPAEAIVGWWDADRVVAEDVVTGLPVIGAPLATDIEPFELFDDVAFENLRLAGDGENALVVAASTLTLVSQDGESVWNAITSCEIRLSR